VFWLLLLFVVVGAGVVVTTDVNVTVVVVVVVQPTPPTPRVNPAVAALRAHPSTTEVELPLLPPGLTQL
jgi:hypothetical protein